MLPAPMCGALVTELWQPLIKMQYRSSDSKRGYAMIVRIRKSADGRSTMASENDQPDQATCMERLRHEAMEGRALMEAYFAVGDAAARLGASRQSSKAGGASGRNRSGETGWVRRGDYRASNVLSGDDED
jgi:hypothetical protein